MLSNGAVGKDTYHFSHKKSAYREYLTGSQEWNVLHIFTDDPVKLPNFQKHFVERKLNSLKPYPRIIVLIKKIAYWTRND